MDRKQLCIANLTYKRPTANEQKRSRNLLKYLTYRDGRDEERPQVSGKERWWDHGMGGSVTEIAQSCEGYRSQHVLLFSLVLNPNPDLIAMIPHHERETFLRQLTGQTVENFFLARGIDTGVEWSAVLHHRHTDDAQAPGRHNPHTHIILPGTHYDADEGLRVPLYFSRNKHVNHIEMLHRTTERHMEDLLEYYIGHDWEQRIDALEANREQQRAVIEDDPHGITTEEGSDIPFWCGIRQVTEDDCAVGYYLPVTDEESGEATIEFRPIAAGLDADYAADISRGLGNLIAQEAGGVDPLQLYIDSVHLLLDNEAGDIAPQAVRQNEPSTPQLDL